MDLTCPWCGRDVALVLWQGPFWANTKVGDDGRSSHEGHALYLCPRAACNKRTYIRGYALSAVAGADWVEIEAQWPPPGHRTAHESVPGPIAADWKEAHLCIGIGAYKAAAAMARRAVQGVCLERGAKPARLADQIKESVKAGHLHQKLGAWADQVRVFGNAGAHPGDDGLEIVTKEEAEDAVRFMDQLLQWTYVADWELDQSRARSTTPKTGE